MKDYTIFNDEYDPQKSKEKPKSAFLSDERTDIGA